MGLEQYIRAGANLQRGIVSLNTDSIGSGSVNLGSVYALLNISTTAPCRLRLYDNSQSLANAGERVRVFGNTNVSASVALIADISMSNAGNYSMDPAVYGMVQDTVNRLTYYRVENTQSGAFPVISFTRYLMEAPEVSTANRINLPVITGSVQPNIIISGTLSSTGIPRTYLLVSASISGSNNRARIRLYSTNESLTNQTELSRSFATESANNSKLIIDMILSGNETTYFVPKIAGANLQTIGNDLNVLRANRDAIMGLNQLYYILQHPDTTGTTIQVSSSIHVFALED